MASKRRRRLDILAKKDDILKWVSENLPNAEIARRLNCKVDTLKSYYKIFGISYKGNQNRANMKHHESRKPLQEILNGNSSNSIKRLRLISDGIKEEKCECCGLSEWMGRKIPLELHHIDFNHYNNSIENLQLLCSNCHSLAHNYNNNYNKNLSISSEKVKIENPLNGESLTDNADGNPVLNLEETPSKCVETI